MDFPPARQHFYQEVHQADDQIDLAKAALYIAQEEYPQLEPDEYLNALDVMAGELEERLPKEQYPLRIIQSINQYLYQDLGFVGNTTDYYNPRNSFLNEVIDHRTGIPITLSLVYLEIARRINFPMVGVGMPGHFLIRPAFEEMELFVDAFHQGEVLFADDCRERLAQIYNQDVDLQPAHLEMISSRHFLARMLTNLKMIHLNQGNVEKALSAIERILLLFPESPIQLRDRGLLYYHLGHLTAARQDLEAYLMQIPTADDAAIIHQLLEQMGQGN